MTRNDLIATVKGFRDGVLGGKPADGMCYAICAPLQGLLAAYGIEAELVELDFDHNDDFEMMNHFVLRLVDGTVIDPTADQFGMESVYVGPMPPKYLSAKAQAAGR